jgi:uncharacterized membrane protein (DUF4010 family)
MRPDLEVFKLFGEALALGLLVGVERYRGRQPGEKKSAGVRTFGIFSLLGALCGLVAVTPITVATFAAVAALVLLGYYRSPGGSLGLTTEIAALLVFWLGFLLNSHEVAAISLGIVLTIFLASKRPLHTFVREQISEAEFEATLKFLAVVLVVYPILPDRELGPYGFFNPRHVWGLVILVSTLSYSGYFLVRSLGTRRGLMAGSLAGGVVSTTAVTMFLADRARRAPAASRLMGALAVLANSVQGPRVLLLIWVLDPGLAWRLAAPLLGMALLGLAGAWLIAPRVASGNDHEIPLRNPYSVKPALKFALFFTAVLFLLGMANAEMGEGGSLFASAVAGTGSVSAVALSVSRLSGQQVLPPFVAAASILLAIAANALVKVVLTALNGTRQMAIWLAGGLLSMLAAASLLLLLLVTRG